MHLIDLSANATIGLNYVLEKIGSKINVIIFY